MPIQLKADMLAQQALTLDYNTVLNVGASMSSIYGDVTYTSTLQIYDNLKQVGLSLGKSKVTLNDKYQVNWVDGVNVSYMRNYAMNATSVSLSRMKPMGKWGTVGVGVNYSYMFGKDALGQKMPNMASGGWNGLYTNMFMINKRIVYTPAFIVAASPISYTQKLPGVVDTPFSSISKDTIMILANSFNTQITNKFSVNFSWTIIRSSNEFVPIMNSFMVGSKIPF